MKLLQAIQRKFPKHKYAINVVLLGDSSECAWSNLGFWSENHKSTYPQACENLAHHLAQRLNLNSKDQLLDLGCGYGASLLLWQKNYYLKNIQAVELQKQCVNLIRRNIKNIPVFCESYLNLKHIMFENKFDVILCLDSAYHSDLNSFINSACTVLNSKGRIGFHTLMLSEKWNTLTSLQKQKYSWLLKVADVKLKNLNSKEKLEQCLKKFEFRKIEIENLSKPVLYGFSDYVEQGLKENKKNVDDLKIRMTAKLCKKLFEDDFIRYVQVSAEYK